MSEQKSMEAKWVDGRDSPFGISVLDLRSIVHQSAAWTTKREVAESYGRLRRTDGKEYVDKLPGDYVEIACALSFPYPGSHGEGPVFKSKVMEDKWDMYVYADRLYACRSWSGELSFVAPCSFGATTVEIRKLYADRKMISDDHQYAGRVVDYLIKSHMSNRVVPHPLPARMKDMPPGEIATHSFEMYGRRGLFGSYEETIGVMGWPAGST